MTLSRFFCQNFVIESSGAQKGEHQIQTNRPKSYVDTTESML